jgi:hypothetical protein
LHLSQFLLVTFFVKWVSLYVILHELAEGSSKCFNLLIFLVAWCSMRLLKIPPPLLFWRGNLVFGEKWWNLYIEQSFRWKKDIWVSLYVILHELAKGSSKCFKFHYLVSQSILLDTYFLFLPKKKFVSICGVLIFLYQTVDIYTRKSKLAHILCICGSIFTFLDIF